MGTSYSPVYTWTAVDLPPHVDHEAGDVSELIQSEPAQERTG